MSTLILTPEAKEKLHNSTMALTNALMEAIVYGRFTGAMADLEGGESVSVEHHLFEPLAAAGFVLDWDALWFSKASQTNRKRMLKDDPTLASRQIFTIPSVPLDPVP